MQAPECDDCLSRWEVVGDSLIGRPYQARRHIPVKVLFLGAPQVQHITGQNGTDES